MRGWAAALCALGLGAAPLPVGAAPATGVDLQIFGGLVAFPGTGRVPVGGAYGLALAFEPLPAVVVELGYQGAAYTEEAPRTGESVAAVEHGAYGALRLSPFRRSGGAAPYVLTGVTISQLNTVGAALEGGALRDDAFVKVPVGAGVELRLPPFLAGVRVAYGFVFGNREAFTRGNGREADQVLGTLHLGATF